MQLSDEQIQRLKDLYEPPKPEDCFVVLDAEIDALTYVEDPAEIARKDPYKLLMEIVHQVDDEPKRDEELGEDTTWTFSDVAFLKMTVSNHPQAAVDHVEERLQHLQQAIERDRKPQGLER